MNLFRRASALLLAAALSCTAACSTQTAAAPETEQKQLQSADAEQNQVQTAAAASSEAEVTLDPELGFLEADQYQGTVLEQTADAGEDYLEETLFVGDSNTVRYYLYGSVPLQSDIGVSGMATGSITSFPCVQFYGYSQMVTIPRAIGIIQPRRVIFGFGSNNLGGNLETAVKNYRKAVKACLDEYAYFTVIISSVPALDKNRSNKSLKQDDADKLNEMLADMCRQEGWYFLNSAEVLKDPDTGWAVSGYTISDGLHLSEEGVEVYLDYVRTHADSSEDQRPSVPASVPKHTETTVDLLPKTEDSNSSGEASDEASAGTVTVSYSLQGNGTLQGELTQTVQAGNACGEVWVYPSEGWHLDHWEINLDGQSYSEQECLRLTIPEGCRQSSVKAVAYVVEDTTE